jgi:HEAT repeat protein
MGSKERTIRTVRWMLSVLLVIAGLSGTWAWGQVASLAEPESSTGEPEKATLYASWLPVGAVHQPLFRSVDGGRTWQELTLPAGAAPVAWIAGDAGKLAVALEGGTVLNSVDSGDTWATAVEDLPVLSLAWGRHDDLYLGTEGQGIYHLASNGILTPVPGLPGDLEAAAVRHLDVTPDGRLFASTSSALLYTDDGGQTWTGTSPVGSEITALAVLDGERLYVGTATMGVYASADTGQTWKLASEGLGLAAGQMVRVTALRADPEASGVLYATVDHLVGSTHVHASASGAFVSLDGGVSWQALAGPTFPEAEPASGLVVVPGRPLHVQAVTGAGLQVYAPDLDAALAALESGVPAAQTAAARLLGVARVQDPGTAAALVRALSDPDPGVSLAASRALGRIGNPETIGALLVAMDHPSKQVCLGAARALGMMQATAAVEPLSTMFLSGEGLAVTVAAEALGHIATAEALATVLEPLSDLTMTSQRHAALAALETAGEPAVEPLVALLDSDSSHIRRNAAEALGWVAAPEATDALARALRNDRDATVREQAAWALGQIGDPSARMALARAEQRDSAAAVRARATSALARIPDDVQASASWPARWAPALSRLEPLRWLLLVLSLVGAACLATGPDRWSLVPALRRSSQ